MLNRICQITALCLGLALGGGAGANVIITAGNNPQPDENVLLTGGQVGNPVFGVTNQTMIDVSFTSITGQTLVTPSMGQARVEAQGAALTSLVIGVPGGMFESLIFNAFAGSGTITIAVLDNEGDVTQQMFAIGNGQNFFTITTDALESIVSATLTFSDSVRDVRQVRLGGAALLVPEPATLALLVFGVAAVAARRHRKR